MFLIIFIEDEISPLEERMQMFLSNVEVDLSEGIEELVKKSIVYPLLLFFSIKSR